MIENEVKYVLSLNSFDHTSIINNSKILEIKQGYDKNGARFRKQNNEYFFNYKTITKAGVDEFELKISKEEFDRCFDTCIEKLHKKRYTLKDHFGNTWDIDFFLNDDKLYFAMAECEMLNENQEFPEKIIDFVDNFCVYIVPRKHTKKYSSRKLSNVEYAKTVFEKIDGLNKALRKSYKSANAA
jgi:CYTH domain-containing protein